MHGREGSSLFVLDLSSRVRPRFFDQVGHQTTNASIENNKLTKIGHIFSEQSTLKIKVFKKFHYISWSPYQIFFTEIFFEIDSINFRH